ncbi:hypothetical protein DFH06DRAFT_1135193 [Mycena polygramma]|nr:hypothetical protein DFH06DRAFT_1135193 [Mycena polygramma]
MSDPFEQSRRVAVACLNCRERKVKCMAHPEQKPCMRCEQNGLICEYVSTEKQRSRGSGSKQPRTSNPATAPFPTPTSNTTPNMGGYGQFPSHGGYGQGPSHGGYTPSAAPTMGGSPYGTHPTSGDGSQHRPSNHRSNTYPSTPNYQVPAQPQAPGMPYPSGMPSAMYPSSAPPQQPVNPGYPLGYDNYAYDWNAPSQSQ